MTDFRECFACFNACDFGSYCRLLLRLRRFPGRRREQSRTANARESARLQQPARESVVYGDEHDPPPPRVT